MDTIRLFKVRMSENAGAEVDKVLRSGYIGEGPKVKEFEKQLENMFMREHCLASMPSKFVLTTNSATSAEHLALHTLKQQGYLKDGDEVLATPLTCLYGKQSISLPDGSSKTIAELVHERYDGEVVSYNIDSGQLENKRVIGWYKSPLADRYWIRVSFEHAGLSNQQELRGAWVTNEHRVLTTNGYIRADQLQPGDQVITSFQQPNPQQQELLVGAMLGDGGLALKTKGQARFETGHTIKNQDYVAVKHTALDGIVGIKQNRPEYKYTKASQRFQSKSTPFFTQWHHEWYLNNQKIVAQDLCNNYFSVLSLAIWYMDDGSYADQQFPAIVFCSESFSKEDNQYLIGLLKDKFDITATLQKHRKGYRLYIGSGSKYNNSINKLQTLVAPYIVPSMRYKLSCEINTKYPFNETLYDLGTAEAYTDNVVVVEGEPRCQTSHLRSAYCIDVEDNHNFVASSIVVHNCTATNWPIVANGLRIKWVDIDPETLNMDLNDLARKMTPTTKAVMVVHWGGYPVDMQRLLEVCHQAREKFDFWPSVIQDCAHALGSRYRESSLITWADFSTFSFQAIKHLTCGDGGALVTIDEEAYKLAKLLRWYGIDRDQPKADFRCEADIKNWGYKFHMNDISASIGLTNLKILDETLAAYKANGKYYDEVLQNVPGVSLLKRHDDRESSHWIYTIRVDRRDDFMKMMKEKNVEVSRVHERNDKHTCMSQFKTILPTLDTVVQDMICIPVGWHVTQEQREYIVEAIKGGW